MIIIMINFRVLIGFTRLEVSDFFKLNLRNPKSQIGHRLSL